jgi:hypothetical protein
MLVCAIPRNAVSGWLIKKLVEFCQTVEQVAGTLLNPGMGPA